MRARWTVGGIAAIATGIGLFWAVGSSRAQHSSSEATTSSHDSASTGIPADELHDPTKPYEPGPSAIAYDQLSVADKASVDHVRGTTETAQPDSSYQAFAAATAWTSAHTEQQLAERAVGLVGTAEDGVVP